MDKIRILWTDDRHQESGYPEGRLPMAYQQYFEVVDPRSRPGPEDKLYAADYSFSSAAELAPHLLQLWHRESPILPCEILATDYDLTKPSLGSDRFTRHGVPADEYGGPRHSYETAREAEPETAPEVKPSTVERDANTPVNFDGLIINTIYSCLTHEHPSALVSMTSLMSKMPAGVRTLHEMARPFVGANFEANLGANDRSWEKIIEVALPNFRTRIEELHAGEVISLSMRDLMALASDSAHGILTITSPLATRRLPVEGIFYDIAEATRPGTIRRWAEDRLHYAALGRDREEDAVPETCEESSSDGSVHTFFREAERVAGVVWDAYCDEQLMAERRELSRLFYRESELTEEEAERLKELRAPDKFNVALTAKGVDSGDCKNYVDVRLASRNKPLCRWVCVDVLSRWLWRALEAHLALKREGVRAQHFPELSVGDACLALFPLPKNPLVLPWDSGDAPFDKGKAWGKALAVDLKDKDGDYRIHLEHVLDGRGWNGAQGILGLHSFERDWVLNRIVSLLLENSSCTTQEEAEEAILGYSTTESVVVGGRS